MGVELTPSLIGRFKHIARSLPASKRSAFQASVALEFCDGSPRLAESTFGWSRRAVQLGIANLETSTVYRRTPSAGRPRTEDKIPGFERAIRSLVEPRSQVDPKFQSPFL